MAAVQEGAGPLTPQTVSIAERFLLSTYPFGQIKTLVQAAPSIIELQVQGVQLADASAIV
ncbi:MAG: hypothetical protein DMG23_09260 [Acidobacteria bacterium]|nr:MAG: hypothetical protein DMG23_09260 [Acidobacteriota bacterium]